MIILNRAVFLPVILFALSATVTAREAGDNLETMVVTAARIPLPPAQVGSSMTVIDQAELNRRQTVPLSEILRDVPGMAVSRSGVSGSATQLRLRGAEANQILVMIDGIEANDPAQGNEFNPAHLLATEIQRIEVIRGPQSALWGSDALAGVVNIITREGEGRPAVSGFLEGGSFATVYGGGNLAGGGDGYHYNLGGSVLDSKGANIARRGNENDGYDNATISFKGGFDATDALSFRMVGRHVEAGNEFDDTDPLTGLPTDADSDSKSDRDYGRIRAELDLLDGRWQHVMSGGIVATENDNFSAGAEISSTQGRRYEFDYQTSYAIDETAFGGVQQTVTLAFDYEQEDFTQRGTATAFGDPNQEQSIETTGVIGEYRAAAGENWSFTAGVRHDNHSDFRDNTSYRFTGSYHLRITGTRLRAAYGTGSKNPTFTERYGFFAGSPNFIGNPDLEPERSEGWEAGFDQPLWSGRAQVGLTYFNEDLENEINGLVFMPTLGASTALNVDGTSHRQGIEATGRIRISDGLTLKGNYTWLDATEPGAAGKQITEIRRPKHTASANLNYAFADGRGNINLNAHYNGEQFDTWFPPFPQPSRRVTLDDFTLVNLAASWQLTGMINIYGRIENLLDENYEEIFGFATPGIGAYAGLRVNFTP